MITFDSFGNKYWNKFSKTLIFQNFIYNNNEINSDWTSIKQFFEDFFGDRFTGGLAPADPSGFTLTSVFEEKTTSTGTDYTGNRFIIKGSGESSGVGISSDSALISPSISVAANNIFNDTSSTKATIISIREDCVVGFIFENIPPAPLTCKGMIAFGWLVNGIYPDDNLTGYGNAFFIIGNDTDIEAFHLSEKNSNVKKAILTSGLANFTFESANAGVTIPADAVTNLVLVDADSSQMIGSVPSNLLVGKGNISLGTLYKLTSVVGQGNSNTTPNLETRVFLAARAWDSRKLLLRVPSVGLINADPYFDNVVLYLRGDGDNNSTNIIDSSLLNNTLTIVGNTKISTARSKFGGSSLYFDGSGDCLTTAPSSNFNLGTIYTIEFWINFNATGQANARIFKQKVGDTYGGIDIVQNGSGTGIYLYYSTNNSSFNIVNNATILASPVLNTWYHVALVVNGSTATAYVNGTQVWTIATWAAYTNSSNTGCIGGQTGTSRSINGYIDSLRITKGIARYTATFNPEIDTYMADTYLAINDISNNVLTSSEKSSPLTISGVSYGLNNLTVTVTLNGINYTSTVVGNAWSVTVPPADLQNLTLTSYTVTASVTKDAQVISAQKLLYVSITDPYFSNVVLYLRGTGTIGSTTITDESYTPKTVTRFGTVQISATQSKYEGNSILFSRSTSNYLTLAASSDWQFPGDFTIEGWFYWEGIETSGGCVFLATGGAGSTDQLGVFSGNLYGYGSSNWGATSSIINKWTHIAICRSGSSIKAFINGVQSGTTVTNGNTLGQNLTLFIGKRSDNNHPYGGYIDSLRITKGVARYTVNFNPETDTYLS